jgi:hypothetical protein
MHVLSSILTLLTEKRIIGVGEAVVRALPVAAAAAGGASVPLISTL